MSLRKWISAHHPRDGKGRFARKGGGGSSSKRSSSKRSPAKRSSAKRTPNQRRRVRNAAISGAAIGFLGTLGNPVAAVAGAAIGGSLARRNIRKKR